MFGQNTMCAVWGGFFKDIKRRDTSNYMFATAGKKRYTMLFGSEHVKRSQHVHNSCSIRIWCLDPVNGAWPVMGENVN